MKVNVDGIGLLEFPDKTDMAVVQATVKKMVEEKKGDKEGFLQKYVPSVADTIDIYKQEVSGGTEAVNRAFEKPTGRNLAGGALGALQYAFSPLTAFARGMIGNPIKENLERIDVLKNTRVPVYGKNIPSFVGDMAETGAALVPYGQLVQTAIAGQKAAALTPIMAEAVSGLKSAKTINKPLQMPEKLSAEVIEDAIKPISEAHQKILKTDAVENIAKNLRDSVSQTWDPAQKRITQELADYIVDNPKEIQRVADVYKLTPEQLSAQLIETNTLAGRSLNRMSQLAKDLKKKFATPYMAELTRVLERDLPEIPTMDKFGTLFKTTENVRRVALTSQVATAARNVISQTGRLTLGSVDDAFQGAANAYLKSAGQGTFNSVKSTVKGLGEGLDVWVATINRMRPKERQKLLDLLDADNALTAKATMYNAPVQDVIMSHKITKVLGYLNKTQEFFFRNIAFEAKLRQLAGRAGLDLKNLQGADIPEAMFKEAAEYSLEMTFAALPKSQFGREFVRAMSNPVMTAAINPFPRFLYGNALPFLKNFSPIGFLEAANPKVVADIVSGHPEKFVKAISQATLGTLMLNAASHIRNSEYAGEKWYEITHKGKTYDMRPYAPFSTYLFLAEAMSAPEKIKPADFFGMLLSINRVGGTGLAIADMIRGDDATVTVSNLKRFAGGYFGGFTVPAKNLKEVYSMIDPEESILRDIKGDEFWGQMKQNIPGLSQTMPERVSPLQVGPIKTEKPLLRMLTGLSGITKTELQKEVDELQFPLSRIYPRTGDPRGDRVVSRIMSHYLNAAYPALVEKTNYHQLDDLTKKIILGELFTATKKQAKNIVAQTDKELALKIKIETIPEDIQKYLEQRGVLP